MNRPPARAAAIRGDDYQHLIGWSWLCHLLTDASIERVVLEDPNGGAFDDVVVHYRSGRITYIQVKSSNTNATIVDSAWLTTPATLGGRSPLQRFHDTLTTFRGAGAPFALELWTNRNYDHLDPILGALLDKQTNKIDTVTMLAAGSRSRRGRLRDDWASHLGVDAAELAVLLDNLVLRHTEAEADWRDRVVPLMKLAGLRSDDQAVQLGLDLVRNAVKSGQRSFERDTARRAVASAGLLARSGTVLLAVHGIDRVSSATVPNVELDFRDLYLGESSFERRTLRNPAAWNDTVLPAFTSGAEELASFGTKRVHVVGNMRYSMWFAAGRVLPRVRGWTLSLDQGDQLWASTDAPEPVSPRELAARDFTAGSDLAVAVALTSDPTDDVVRYLESSGVPAGRLIVLGPPGDPSQNSVTSSGWALGWAWTAREIIEREAKRSRNTGLHLFPVAPAGVICMLGHIWNNLPPTTLYEYVNFNYEPTLTVPG